MDRGVQEAGKTREKMLSHVGKARKAGRNGARLDHVPSNYNLLRVLLFPSHEDAHVRVGAREHYNPSEALCNTRRRPWERK
ncbi:hypothetical protein E2C01_016903 [Portunus trituberculatus]|uniref:Uncharacterized protein n=1 Tax=Portunus trituberculatus TaxID=210409 RepID=A0A5B7DSD6_PORTR|nr:hypothetical protein [Portunus trituberculatus]